MKQTYLKSEDLAKSLEESQALGHPTVEACRNFQLIATHLLGDPRYRSYPKELQEDMVSNALLKCIKNIHNYKKEKAATCFNYFTRCVEHSFWDTLAKHYKQMNLQRELLKACISQLDHIDTKEAKQIRDSLLEDNTTNTLKR